MPVLARWPALNPDPLGSRPRLPSSPHSSGRRPGGTDPVRLDLPPQRSLGAALRDCEPRLGPGRGARPAGAGCAGASGCPRGDRLQLRRKCTRNVAWPRRTAHDAAVRPGVGGRRGARTGALRGLRRLGITVHRRRCGPVAPASRRVAAVLRAVAGHRRAMARRRKAPSTRPSEPTRTTEPPPRGRLQADPADHGAPARIPIIHRPRRTAVQREADAKPLGDATDFPASSQHRRPEELGQVNAHRLPRTAPNGACRVGCPRTTSRCHQWRVRVGVA